jgi:hypothetical protein
MHKRYKDLIHDLVGKLRYILVGTTRDGLFRRGDLDYELERLGIAPDGRVRPLDVFAKGQYAHNVTHTGLKDTHRATTSTLLQNGELRTYYTVVAQLNRVSPEKRASKRSEIIERAAYTWINRLLALRIMETRGLIDNTLRGDRDYGGLSEKLYFLHQDKPERAADDDKGWWTVIENACNEQARSLPGLFALDDPGALPRPSTTALLQCIDLVGGVQEGYPLEEADTAFADPDAIGWAYQFYQEEPKALIDAKLKQGGKVVTRAEIAAKTQLFTEPYMVQWLLENSLGRSYHEFYPQSKLPDTWPYYIKPEHLEESRIEQLTDLTLLEPCMGSGHFLRIAFHMFVAIYREQRPTLTAREIADKILSQHLYGIDLDPRAAQLAALTLYLCAWELVRDEEHRERKLGGGPYVPPTMHLVTTPHCLASKELQEYLQRHPYNSVLRSLLDVIFAGLKHADILGSLLRPREYLDQGIDNLLRLQTIPLEFDREETAQRRILTEMAKQDYDSVKVALLEYIAGSFATEEKNTDDVSAMLFGRDAGCGVRLLRLLDRRYAVVVTNPPYLGSNYMGEVLKKYTEKYYTVGKRDLYAAFILRCLELCQAGGRVAMVTMQSWMFLRSFAELRAVPEEKREESEKKSGFMGLLRQTSIEVLAHLGRSAFQEISGEIVKSTMFTLSNRPPSEEHRMLTFRLEGFKDAKEKADALRKSSLREIYQYTPVQRAFVTIAESPLSYWLANPLLVKFAESKKLSFAFLIKGGLSTTDNARFVRFHWETPLSKRWLNYTKGGGYSKWAGNNYYSVDWEFSGSRMKAYIVTIPGNTHWSRRIFNSEYYFRPGYSYSPVASGTLGVRKIDDQCVLGHKGPAIFPISDEESIHVAGVYNARLITYMLRAIAPQLGFEVNHLLSLPNFENNNNIKTLIAQLSECCVRYKESLLSLGDITEKSYLPTESGTCVYPHPTTFILSALLLSCEACLDKVVFQAYSIDYALTMTILSDTGTPAGWYPLVTNYDTLPLFPQDLTSPPLPQELYDYHAMHERISPGKKELVRIKDNLQALYESGSRAKNAGQEESDKPMEESEEGMEMTLNAHIPIPTETFLEELSIKLHLHPISVYWLLEELRSEGVRGKQEERRLLEDRLSVLVLWLLGHRWPKQLEEREPLPGWAEGNGIIPLVEGTGSETLAERLRGRLRDEEGPLVAQQTEALLTELTGWSLEDWLRRRFFQRHMQQFRYRPVAWHLVSKPTQGSSSSKKRRGGSITRHPVFECMLYYHACSSETLPRLRTQYVEPLLQAERSKVEEDAYAPTHDMASAIIQERIRELEAFLMKLRSLEEKGFACPELEPLLAEEPLDRWSGDGYLSPLDHAALCRNEEAWHVDSNDGVRVNIAPLQRVGILASDVLKPTDVKKAIADRAQWRADERRWVRQGKLPRCGWMSEDVPESPRWREREPHRLAEEARLAQKRMALQ